jgi:high affinity choline transporter 7
VKKGGAMKGNTFYAGLVVMVIIYVGLFLVAWIAPRKRQKAEGGELNSTDLFLAGRSIPLWMAIFTMTATWVGGGYLGGTAEMVYAWGQGWAQAGWGYALSLIIGGIFFAKKMREHNFTTMLDPFEQRFGKDGAAILYIPALLGEIFWTAAIMVVLGASFAAILGVSLASGIIITAAVTIAYTLMSGLWAVAYTDVVQLSMVIVFLLIAVFIGTPKVGGWNSMWGNYNEAWGTLGAGFIKGYFPPLNAGRDPNWGPWILNWWDYGLLYVFGGIPWHCYIQRVLASKNGRTARWMSIGAGVLAFLMVIPPTLLAVIGYNFDWVAIGVTPPEWAVLILPYVLRYVMPPVIGALGLGAVAAAVMSSVDSSVLSASSMFTWNIYRSFLKPEATDKQLKTTLRITIVIIGAIATALALTLKSTYTLWYFCSDLVYTMLFPSLVAALFFKRANKIGVYAGILVAIFLRFMGGIPEFGFSPIFKYWIYSAEYDTVLFPFRTMAMIIGLITIVVVSNLTQKAMPARPLKKIEV